MPAGAAAVLLLDRAAVVCQGIDAGQCHVTSPTPPLFLACMLSRLPPQMHYTWGPQFKKGDTLVWEFDKRKYTEPKHEQEVGGG